MLYYAERGYYITDEKAEAWMERSLSEDTGLGSQILTPGLSDTEAIILLSLVGEQKLR